MKILKKVLGFILIVISVPLIIYFAGLFLIVIGGWPVYDKTVIQDIWHRTEALVMLIALFLLPYIGFNLVNNKATKKIYGLLIGACITIVYYLILIATQPLK